MVYDTTGQAWPGPESDYNQALMFWSASWRWFDNEDANERQVYPVSTIISFSPLSRRAGRLAGKPLVRFHLSCDLA